MTFANFLMIFHHPDDTNYSFLAFVFIERAGLCALCPTTQEGNPLLNQGSPIKNAAGAKPAAFYFYLRNSRRTFRIYHVSKSFEQSLSAGAGLDQHLTNFIGRFT